MCARSAEQHPFIKAQKIRQASLFNQEMGLIPAPFCGCEVCVCDHGPSLRSGISTAEDAVVFWRKFFRILISPNHYPYSYSPRHPQEATEKGASSRAKDALSFLLPSFLWVSRRPRAKSKVQKKEDPSTSSERSEAAPQHGPVRETEVNPTWVWLLGFSNFCLPSPDVSPRSKFCSTTSLPGSAALPWKDGPPPSPPSHRPCSLPEMMAPTYIWAQAILEPDDTPFGSQWQ